MTRPPLPPDYAPGHSAPVGETSGAHALVTLALAESPEPCAVASADGSLVFVNTAMLRAAGCDPAGPRPADLCALAETFRGGGFDDPAAAVGEVLRTGRAFERDVADFKSGGVLALRISPVTGAGTRDDCGADGAVPAVLGIALTARDVTRRHDAERLRAALVSLVSHELRTPLTSIGGFAELLAEDDELPAEAREFLAIIREETRRLARMVSAFFAGVQSEGDGAAACEPVSFGEVSREAVSHFGRAAAERGVVLTLRDSPRLPPVAAGRRLVASVVGSMLDETIRRADPGATVVVSSSLEAATVSLAVESRPAPGHSAALGGPRECDTTLREAVEQQGGRLVRESTDGAELVRLTFPRL